MEKKRYRFTVLGKDRPEEIEAEAMDFSDGAFSFVIGGKVVRSLYATSLEGPPIEIEPEDGSAWDEELRRSDLPYGQG